MWLQTKRKANNTFVENAIDAVWEAMTFFGPDDGTSMCFVAYTGLHFQIYGITFRIGLPSHIHVFSSLRDHFPSISRGAERCICI
jgi:hypothetical protein